MEKKPESDQIWTRIYPNLNRKMIPYTTNIINNCLLVSEIFLEEN